MEKWVRFCLEFIKGEFFIDFWMEYMFEVTLVLFCKELYCCFYLWLCYMLWEVLCVRLFYELKIKVRGFVVVLNLKCGHYVIDNKEFYRFMGRF